MRKCPRKRHREAHAPVADVLVPLVVEHCLLAPKFWSHERILQRTVGNLLRSSQVQVIDRRTCPCHAEANSDVFNLCRCVLGPRFLLRQIGALSGRFRVPHFDEEPFEFLRSLHKSGDQLSRRAWLQTSGAFLGAVRHGAALCCSVGQRKSWGATPLRLPRFSCSVLLSSTTPCLRGFEDLMGLRAWKSISRRSMCLFLQSRAPLFSSSEGEHHCCPPPVSVDLALLFSLVACCFALERLCLLKVSQTNLHFWCVFAFS